jgi:hypothetical protein
VLMGFVLETSFCGQIPTPDPSLLAFGYREEPKPHQIHWPGTRPGKCIWRRERDSNPRGELPPPSDLANRPLQPLGYLSTLFCYSTRFARGFAKRKRMSTGDPAGFWPLDCQNLSGVESCSDVAEGEGFEPSVPLPARWFSRPFPSTARTPFRKE